MPQIDEVTLDRLREIAAGRLLIRQTEAAKALGISKLQLLREIEAGRLRYVLVGTRRRFKPTDLAAYIQRQERGCEDHSSSGDQDRPTGIATSMSEVVDFATALARTPGRTPKRSPHGSMPTPNRGGPEKSRS